MPSLLKSRPPGGWPCVRHAALALVFAAICGSAQAQVSTPRRAGDFLSWALPAGVLATEIYRQDWEGSLQFGASYVATVAATEVLKRVTHVERPDHSNDDSFPSGHAARAFAAATYVHRRHGLEHAWPLYAVATYVGYTRVHERRHRWGDVAGAAAVSAVASWALVRPQGPQIAVGLQPGGLRVVWTTRLP
jgi:membrane-associated phospholipid phosphatase